MRRDLPLSLPCRQAPPLLVGAPTPARLACAARPANPRNTPQQTGLTRTPIDAHRLAPGVTHQRPSAAMDGNREPTWTYLRRVAGGPLPEQVPTQNPPPPGTTNRTSIRSKPPLRLND